MVIILSILLLELIQSQFVHQIINTMNKLSCNKIPLTTSDYRSYAAGKHLFLIILFLAGCCCSCKKQCVTCFAAPGFYRLDSTIVISYDSALHRYDTLVKLDTIDRWSSYPILSFCPGSGEYNSIIRSSTSTIGGSGLQYCCDSLGRTYTCYYNQ